jgi:putative hemolysin
MHLESGLRLTAAEPLAPGHLPLHTAVDPDLIERQLDASGPDALLVRAGRWDVRRVEGPLEPELLLELGRLRERTFRLVGEGTGRAIDVDRFDDHYTHLIVWDRAEQAIAGAYRLARTDRVRATRGAEGLYVHTLFAFGEAYLDALGPALELGRSFVTPEYQGGMALAMLWRGIGEWLNREPEIRALTGVASFDRRYDDTTLALMVAALEAHHAMPSAVRLTARPRTPFEPAERPSAEAIAPLASIATLNRRVLERTGDRGLPVLVKNYLLLGARVVGFNVDHDFSDVVDALIVVERERIDPRRLARFTGAASPEAAA